jgi:hypothetical protein
MLCAGGVPAHTVEVRFAGAHGVVLVVSFNGGNCDSSVQMIDVAKGQLMTKRQSDAHCDAQRQELDMAASQPVMASALELVAQGLKVELSRCGFEPSKLIHISVTATEDSGFFLDVSTEKRFVTLCQWRRDTPQAIGGLTVTPCHSFCAGPLGVAGAAYDPTTGRIAVVSAAPLCSSRAARVSRPATGSSKPQLK